MPRRLFALEEANALLPWLESKFAEVDRLRDEALRSQERRDDMTRQVQRNGGSSSEEEMQLAQQRVTTLPNKVQEIIAEIANKGVIVRNLSTGLVDFPSMRDGWEVQLCWLRGEPEIQFWHTYETGFAGRQPL